MLNWSRNGALILMDLESPFWRFLNDELDVILVKVIPSFGRDTLASSPSAMTSREPKEMDDFHALNLKLCDVLL